MPCDTISLVNVNLGKVNFDLFVEGLKSLNLHPYVQGQIVYFGQGESFNKATNELKVRSQGSVAKLKQAYSAQVVKSQAKKFGWQLKETAPFQYSVMKR